MKSQGSKAGKNNKKKLSRLSAAAGVPLAASFWRRLKNNGKKTSRMTTFSAQSPTTTRRSNRLETAFKLESMSHSSRAARVRAKRASASAGATPSMLLDEGWLLILPPQPFFSLPQPLFLSLWQLERVFAAHELAACFLTQRASERVDYLAERVERGTIRRERRGRGEHARE